MTLLVFILVLSILVFVHELGHFVAAKRVGIKVEEFGFGLPPRLWGKKVGETVYSINALPIGGFVRLYGEDGAASVKDEGGRGRAYYEQPIWQRAVVLLAGVSMNLLLAIFAFSLLYNIYGVPVKTDKIMIAGVAENSPAAEAGLKPDDRVVTVDGQEVDTLESFVALTKEKAGEEITLEVERKADNPCQENQTQASCRGNNLLLTLIPRQEPPEGEGPLGVAISDTELKKFPWYQMIPLGIKEGFEESFAWGGMIVGALRSTFVSIFTRGEVPKDIAGPVGIFQITGQATKTGAWAVVQFLGILSVNLAIVNILPLPALDGGRLVFLGYEAVTKKKANPKIENWVNTIGMAFLLGLMLLITINDILRLARR